MANLLRAHIELVPVASIDPIMELDASVTTNLAKYKQENRLAYYICINSWLHICKNHAPTAWLGLLELISKRGLFHAIKECSDQSDNLINGQPTSGFARSLMSELDSGVLTTALMLLRYPKRFSPLLSDKISEKSIRDFINIENSNKMKQRRELPRWIVSRVRSVITQLAWDTIREPGVDDYSFTTGVTYEGARTLGEKLKVLNRVKPSFFHNIMGEPAGFGPQQVAEDYYGPGMEHKDMVRYLYPISPVKLRSVPKTYKAARIIAMEPTVVQLQAKAIALQLERILPEEIPLHNQEQNRELAYKGSLDGSLATIDLSHASDSITKTMIVELFPPAVAKLLLSHVGTHIDYPKNGRRLMHMFSTAGNALTFIVESIVFWAITSAAIEFKYELDGAVDSTCSVYGDDIIVATETMPFVIMFLEALGFTVNTTKSFGPGTLYRESCGAELANGIDLSSVYFPRTPIRGNITPDSIVLSHRAITDGITTSAAMALVSLQRRLFSREFSASMFIYELMREAIPNITASSVDKSATTSDLISYNEICREGGAPSGVWVRSPQSRLQKTWNMDLPRTGHSTPSLIIKERVLTPEEENYLYKAYLQYGPLYDSPYDELLRLSSSRRRVFLRSDAVEFRWTIYYN